MSDSVLNSYQQAPQVEKRHGIVLVRRCSVEIGSEMCFGFASSSDATNARGWCVSSPLEIGLPTASADVGFGDSFYDVVPPSVCTTVGGIPQVYNESMLTCPHSEFC